MNRELDKAVHATVTLFDEIIASIRVVESPADRIDRAQRAHELRAELLEAYDLARAEERSTGRHRVWFSNAGAKQTPSRPWAIELPDGRIVCAAGFTVSNARSLFSGSGFPEFPDNPRAIIECGSVEMVDPLGWDEVQAAGAEGKPGGYGY